MRNKKKDKIAQDTLSLMSYIQFFQITDLLAFGKLLGVEEDDDFEEYLTNIVTAYTEQPKRKKDKFLNFAKLIASREENVNQELREKFREKIDLKLKEPEKIEE